MQKKKKTLVETVPNLQWFDLPFLVSGAKVIRSDLSWANGMW